jgi:non-heme chloroperoxidase
MHTKSVSLGHDVTLEYAEYGDPKGVPVIFLHGVTDSHRSFDPIVPYLPGAFRAFAISQRGHGHSSRPLAGYRYADFAGDLHRFMTELRLPSAIIVGHSMGSVVAQRFAIDHPSRTLGLVLVGAFPTLVGHPDLQQLWATELATLTDPVDDRLIREFQESTIALPIGSAFFETVLEESRKVPAAVWRATFAEFLSTDFSSELSRVQAPALMIWGDRDAFCRTPQIEALGRALPHARAVVYANVGHAVHWEVPERFAGDLVSFVQEHCLHHAF